MENSSSVLPILFYPSFSSAYDPLPFPCTHTPLIPNLICPKHPSKFKDLCTKSRCQMKTGQKNVTSTLDLHCGSRALLSDHIIVSGAMFRSLAGSLHQACDCIACLVGGSCRAPEHCFCCNGVGAEWSFGSTGCWWHSSALTVFGSRRFSLQHLFTYTAIIVCVGIVHWYQIKTRHNKPFYFIFFKPCFIEMFLVSM